MKTLDTRCLSPDAQEALRFPVARAVRGGMKKAAAARTFAVSRISIDRWLAKVALGNVNSLESKPRGRPKGTRLAPCQAVTTVRLITDRCPDQLKMPFGLWTRQAVQQLPAERFGLQVAVWTVGCSPTPFAAPQGNDVQCLALSVMSAVYYGRISNY